ncbi:MAG TPA: hypothetical protein VFA46_24280 [Actinomycetes bacterium]|nr:hypothetical protein [Actinomycetes bacterium]
MERARLLGFTRGECLSGPEEGLLLVRSMWRAQVRLQRWTPQFEIAHRPWSRPARRCGWW